MSDPRRVLQKRSHSAPAAPASRSTRRRSTHRHGTPVPFSFSNLPIKAPSPGQNADETTEPAPAALAGPQNPIDYERLLADGELSLTIAVGHESKDSKARSARPGESVSANKARSVRTWLKKNNFARVEARQEPGKEHYAAERPITYPGKDGVPKTRSVKIRINLIVPREGAAKEFARALNESEVLLYTGHARGGMGPDFDGIKKKLENFVLGAYSKQHEGGVITGSLNAHAKRVVTREVNDLERMTRSQAWTPDKYRVWFFNACTSLLYVNDIRGGLLPPDMGSENLGLLGTKRTVSAAAGAEATLAFLDGLLTARPAAEIVEDMNRQVARYHKKGGMSDAELARRSDTYFSEGGTADAAP